MRAGLAVFLTVILAAATAHAAFLDFESVPGAYDNMPISDQFWGSHGIRFRYTDDFVTNGPAILERTGADGTDAFASAGTNDIDRTGSGLLGNWFLRGYSGLICCQSNGLSYPSRGQLRVEYSSPVALVQFDIWDIEGPGGASAGQNEQWRLTAYNSSGQQLFQPNLTSTAQTNPYGNGSYQPFDGRAYQMSVGAYGGPNVISSLVLDYVGTKNWGVGLGFDRFYSQRTDDPPPPPPRPFLSSSGGGTLVAIVNGTGSNGIAYSSVSVSNSGDGGNVEGYYSADYSGDFQNDGCSFNLAPGESCARNVWFQPTVRGEHHTNIVMNTNLGSPIRTFFGRGVAPVGVVDGEDAGAFLVGHQQTRDADATVRNIGDASAYYGSTGNLRGQNGAVAAVNLSDNGQTTIATSVTFTAGQRGQSLSQTQQLGQFQNGSTDGRNQAFTANATFTGVGVAPVAEMEADTDQPQYVLVGGTRTVTVGARIRNRGDGNRSGLGELSNLHGTAGETEINLTDNGEIDVNVDVDVTASQRGEIVTGTMTADFSNGSADGLNAAHQLEAEVSAIGVAPVAFVAGSLDLDGDGSADSDATMVTVGDATQPRDDAGTSSNLFDDSNVIRIAGRRGQVSRFAIQVTNTGDGQLADSEEGKLRFELGRATGGEFSGAGSEGMVALGDNESAQFAVNFRPRRNGTFETSVTLTAENGSTDDTNSAFSHDIVLQGTTEGQGAGLGGVLQFGAVGIDTVDRRCEFQAVLQTADQIEDCRNGTGQASATDSAATGERLVLLGATLAGLDGGIFNVSGFDAACLAGNTVSCPVVEAGVAALPLTLTLDLARAAQHLRQIGVETGFYAVQAEILIRATDSVGLQLSDDDGQPLVFSYVIEALLDAHAIVPTPGLAVLLVVGVGGLVLRQRLN